jgi:heterodisulfide reductase subunit C2
MQLFQPLSNQEPVAMQTTLQQPLVPAHSLPDRLAQEAAISVSACYQCKKCSSGCPLTFAMDLLPDRVIRLAGLGQTEVLLGCRTIWVCASCVTCTTRCPNGIDIAGVMDWLKEEAIRQGEAVDQPEVAAVQRFFLDSIRQSGGRLPEVALMRRFTLFKLRRQPDLKELWENVKLGWALFQRGRLRPVGPPALKGRDEINRIFQRTGA